MSKVTDSIYVGMDDKETIKLIGATEKIPSSRGLAWDWVLSNMEGIVIKIINDKNDKEI